MVFIRWATTGALQEEILYCSPLERIIRAADVLVNVENFYKKHELEWQNLSSVCTDGAPAMLGPRSGFANLIRDLNPEATSVHCIHDTLAIIADMFEKLNQLNLSLQGQHATILKLSDSINSFLQKIVLWKSNAEINVFAMFETLLSLGDGRSINSGIIEHLSRLREEFQYYFLDRNDMNLDVVRNPFHAKPETLQLELQDEFIDVINDSTFKTAFEKEDLETAWCNISLSYPRISKYVLKMLVAFSTTYLHGGKKLMP
ncbi:SCAN domain-containing protein 3 [Oopsacas minuta]|uniref:SCAN domain-containing protein 3 n=1 Tax=Oopsacas minuta TaxID=111878 RepID=A0AAV7JHQ9_9METZ|nr:SCAN domain-containing protein 3 [Oopsacas minuta]